MIDASIAAMRTDALAKPGLKRKILFVGDNRVFVNWGRGASLALSQLLSLSFQIAGRITGDAFVLGRTELGYIKTFLPPRFSKLFIRLLLNPHKPAIFTWYVKLERWLGAKDFIAEDPAESVDNIIANKHRYPGLARIYDQAVAADAMILDGDGDIIFSNPPRRQTLFLLAMIELGIRLKKPVFLVNTMISDCPTTGRNHQTLAAAKRLFTSCYAVSLRDPESLEYVKQEMPQVKCGYLPDSLFAWFPLFADGMIWPPANGDFILPHPEQDEYWGKLDFSKPYICIGGGAAMGSDNDRAIECYSRLVDAVKELGYAVYLTENDSPDDFLREVARTKNIGMVPANAPILMCGAVLARSRLFISGRYHPSIFAALGGTPCIFLGSHAHKMGSLARVLEYDDPKQFSSFPEDVEISEIISRARSYLAQGETLRERIRNVAKQRCEEVSTLPSLIERHLN